MKKKNNIKIIFTLSIFLNIALVGGSVFMIFQLKNIQQNIISLEQTQKEQKIKTSNLFSLKDIIKKTANERGQLGQYFIKSETGAVTLLEKIENLADTLSIPATISINTNKKSFNNLEKNTLKLDIGTQGTFSEINQFLLLLENLSYKIIINSVSIRRSQAIVSKEVVPKWSMTTSLEIISFIP